MMSGGAATRGVNFEGTVVGCSPSKGPTPAVPNAFTAGPRRRRSQLNAHRNLVHSPDDAAFAREHRYLRSTELP